MRTLEIAKKSFVAAVTVFAAACGSPDAAAPADDMALSATMSPITLAPGDEQTLCATVVLDNEEPAWVSRLAANLSPGSHHLVVYRSNDGEAVAPASCSPFADVVSGNSAPTFIAQTAHEELVMPEGVGLLLAPHQAIRLEVHYLNVTDRPIEVTADVQFELVEEDAKLEEAGIAFWGTRVITIPPNGEFETGTKFQAGIAGTKAFSVSTHQHRLGTHMGIWASESEGQMASTPLLENADWEHPASHVATPPLAFDGTNGLHYACAWKNPTAEEVRFGASATDEMCFLWMHYYPSHGFDLCLDGYCKER